jgi:hypothetical protein
MLSTILTGMVVYGAWTLWKDGGNSSRKKKSRSKQRARRDCENRERYHYLYGDKP